MFNHPRYKIAFLIYDFLSLITLLMIGNWLSGYISFGESVGTGVSYILLIMEFIALTMLFIFVFRYYGLYQINIILSPSKHSLYLMKAVIVFFMLNFIIQLISYGLSNIPLLQFLSLFTFILVSLFILRTWIAVKIYKIWGKLLRNNILIVGEGEAAKIITAKLFVENNLNLNILGFISDERFTGEEVIANKYVLGKLIEMKETIKKYDVDEILISMDKVNYDKLIQIIDECNSLGIRVRLTSKLFRALNEKVNLEKYYDIPILEITSLSRRANYERIKRIFDLLTAFSALIVLLPVLILTAISIKLSSKGPAIFSQERIGKNGKPFKLYKFRSMLFTNSDDKEREREIVDFMKDEDRHENFKVIDEKRVTKVGKVIRSTSIDELPQLFNVVKGDMSLVGPRPCLPYEFVHYQDWQRKRVEVMPGCTGLWQVFGRNSVSFLDAMIMDVYYTYKMSFLTDLEYILRTIPAIILAKGK